MLTLQNLQDHVIMGSQKIAKVLEIWKQKGSENKFFVVVDAKCKLLGTLTDGDIRRGLLQGLSTNDKITLFANNNPIFAYFGDNAAIIKNRLGEAKSATPFVPIVDTAGLLKKVIVGQRKGHKNVSALIMAGGYGRRLKERTFDKPKALVEVGGLPIIEHVFRKIEEAPLKHIYVSVHHFAEQINDYVKKTGRENRVSLIYEDEPLGTAGALGLLKSSSKSHLLVTNCDIITGMDFRSFCEFNIESPNMITVAVAQHQIVIPFGVVRHNLTGDFLGVEEKPVIANSVAAGIYFFKEQISDIVSKKEHLDMPTLIQRAHILGHRVGVFPIHEFWSDVGSLEDLRDVEKKLNNTERLQF